MSLLRQWLRDAPREERRPAAVVGAVALALAAWAVVPIGDGAASVSHTGTAGVGRDDVSTNPHTEGQPDVGVASGATIPGGAGASFTQGPAGRPTGPVGAVATPSTGGAACPPLTASDQGITPTTITVGIGDFDAGNPLIVEQFGFRADAEDVVNALVADINRRGGIACRKLVPRFYKVNPFVESDQRSKCTQAVHDDRVFAFLDPGVLTTRATQSCVTVDNHVPLLSAAPIPASWVQAQAPYFLSHNTDSNRAARNWVLLANQAGFFDRSSPNRFKKVGLLVCRNDGGVTDEIKRNLAAVGVTSINEQILDCQADLVAPSNQVEQAALEHKLAGVTHVLPATLSTNVRVYLQAASSQDFKPKYSASDVGGLAYPGFTEAFDPAQWNGTIGYTHSRSAELRNSQPSPETLRCDAVLRAHGVPGIETEWDDFPRIYCDLLHLLTVGMNRVPANPTRLQFTQAVQTSGRITFSGVSDGVYDRRGKFTGGDFIRSIQWRDDNVPACEKGDGRGDNQSNGCWFVLDPTFRPSY
ncbi:MAG TPA: hypothetical protein VMZ22_03455 [Acidimicrobiales bacterium]|nr:hypothetical protein [Acidimicrobiales bacterium]